MDLLTKCQATFTRLYDMEPSDIPPDDPAVGQAWMDTSTSPPTARQWDGERWVGLNIDLQIGGRNLLPDTKNMSGYVKSPNVTLETDTEGITAATYAATDTLGWNCIQTRKPIPFSVARGKTATLSFWVRSDDYAAINAENNRGLNVTLALCTGTSGTRTLYKSLAGGLTTVLTDDWQKITWTVTLTDDFFSSGTGTIDDDTRLYVQVFDYSLHSMQVKKLKLELGNTATDWTPAPEDVEEKIDTQGEALTEEMQRNYTEAVTTSKEIMLQALEEYTKSGDFESYRETVESQLTLLASQMELKFTETTQQIADVNGDLQSKYETITKYFAFDINGLTIGKSDSPYKMVLDNDRLSLTANDIEVLWLDAVTKEVHTPSTTITDRLNLFGYAIEQDEGGNVNCAYTGGGE